jgi:hypothetical protein
MRNKKIFVGVLIIILIAVYIGAKTFADYVAKKRVDKVIEKASNYVDLSYKKVSVDLLRLDVHIKGVTLTPVGIPVNTKIDEVVVYDIDYKNNPPRHFHIALNGIDIPVDKSNFGAQEELKELGYDEIKANIELDYRYNPENKELYLNRLKYGADKVGSLNLKLYISNVDLSSQNPLVILLSLPNILIHSGELYYKDDSFVPRLLKLYSKREGKDVDEIIDNIIKDIETEISKENDHFSKEVIESFSKFIKNPDRITITISPKKPVSIGRIQKSNPQELPKLLNIKVKS